MPLKNRIKDARVSLTNRRIQRRARIGRLDGHHS